MSMRVLNHGFFGTTKSVGLETGQWNDIPPHGQFLTDLEFLTRYSPRSGTASCVYCKSPSYLTEIASQFPWIHFYVFDHVTPEPEYDPSAPTLNYTVPLTVQVEFNRTTSALEFTKEMARTLGERGNKERESLLMICHNQDPIRQLSLHVLMRPHYTLMDICGIVPGDYLDGEIILPMYIQNNKIFANLVVHQHSKCKSFEPTIYQEEIGEVLSVHAPSLNPRDPHSRAQASSKGLSAHRKHTTRQAKM
jgi:hypothetical protein